MSKKAQFFTFLCCSIAIFFITIFSANAQDRLTEKSKVFINGMGAVKVGMTVEQASKSAGIKLIKENDGIDNCYYVKPQNNLQDVSFMVIDERIVRVDVYNRRVKTVKGAHIGDTEAKIKSLYPGQIKVSRRVYVEGHYLTFVPKNPTDRNYRIIFETNGKIVDNFRSGKMPDVEYIEGCA